MMWFESEYVIDTSAKWVILGNAINELLVEDPADWPAKPVVPAPEVTVTQPGTTVTEKVPQPGPTVTQSVSQPGPTATVTIPGKDTSQTVSKKAVKVKASQPTLRLVQGASSRLAGYGYTAAGKRVKVTWTSSKKSVAAVSASGKVVAKKPGTTTITLKAGTKKTTVKVTVVARKPARSAVTAVSAKVPKTLKVGQFVEVTGKWSPASATGVQVTYRSSNKAVAVVDKAGRITAKAPGKVKVTVKAGGKSKTYTVTVA
jgi:uncharacterized protein YjdB